MFKHQQKDHIESHQEAKENQKYRIPTHLPTRDPGKKAAQEQPYPHGKPKRHGCINRLTGSCDKQARAQRQDKAPKDRRHNPLRQPDLFFVLIMW
jgi:hypothetical protein